MADAIHSTPAPEIERLRAHLRPIEMEADDARILALILAELLDHVFRDRVDTRDLLEVYQVSGEQVDGLRMIALKLREATRCTAVAVDDLARSLPKAVRS